MTAPTKVRLDDQLCFALYAATNAVTRAYRPLLQEIGLTYPQYLVMLTLWQHGAAPVSTIGAYLSLPASAITPLADRLETSGFISRRRDEGDRRIVFIELTERGAALQAAAAKAQQEVVCRTSLEPDELDDLRDELKSLVRRMEANTD